VNGAGTSETNGRGTRTILVVDDEPAMRAALAAVLGRGGFAVELATTGEDGLARLEQGGIDLLVTDLRLPGIGGLDLLRAARQGAGELRTIVITAHGTVEDAVAAMKLGAFDFLTKPFSPSDLLHLAGRALGAGVGAALGLSAGGPGRRRDGEGGAGRARAIVSRDPAMLRVLEVAESVASSRAPVLIEGESGTGKELLARYLHEQGCRRGKAFVAVNCAALPRDLLESELFGHERGAFTGAISRKIGKFELANGGTLLLDEVSEMELGLQAKLLRVLQEYEVDRVGGAAPVPVDVRVVATTNRRLHDLVARGRFREDLYYRLTVIPIVLPPLRERRGDVDLLAEHFLRRLGGGRAKTLGPEARAVLASRAWPGNVRQLENALERAVLLARGPQLTPQDLEDRDAAPARLGLDSLAGLTVREVERRLIFDTLKRTHNNRTQAARLLGISIRTLRNKLAEYRSRGELEPSALTGS
jgi:two-component system response regulator FlrC